MTTIAPEQIKPLDLPSVPLKQRKTLPECPGIYFAIDDAGVIQYIGRSNNIQQRWLQHHRYSQLEVLENVQIAWIQVSDSLLLPSIESALIEYFQPLLNNQISASGSTSDIRLSARVPSEFQLQFKAKANSAGLNMSEALQKLASKFVKGEISLHEKECDRVSKLEREAAEVKQRIENLSA
jgi:excinuclease UvrABC nuclease subunit